jgi:hypothetical protein
LTPGLPRPGELPTFVLSLLLIPTHFIVLRWTGLRHLNRLSGRLRDEAAVMDANQVARLHRLVRLAGRLAPFGSTCLTRSLVLQRLLRARGVDAVLKIGALREGHSLRAHAWLEHGGRVLNDTQEALRGFAALPVAQHFEPR